MPGVLSYCTAILTGMSHDDPPHDLNFVNVLELSATAPERPQESIHDGAGSAETLSGHAPAVNVPQRHTHEAPPRQKRHAAPVFSVAGLLDHSG